MVELLVPNQMTRVRFPSPAPFRTGRAIGATLVRKRRACSNGISPNICQKPGVVGRRQAAAKTYAPSFSTRPPDGIASDQPNCILEYIFRGHAPRAQKIDTVRLIGSSVS